MSSIIEKKCKIIMIPTNQKSVIYINEYRTDDRLVSSKDISNHETNSQGNPTTIGLLEERGYKAQHLYILSDDDIKEDDAYLGDDNNIYYLSTSVNFNGKKIIATTNIEFDLPQPSSQFITKFIEEYDKGNVISDVLVEYECEEINPNPKYDSLKVDKNNTITIKRLAESWNRDEIKTLINLYATTYVDGDIDEWISNNL